MKTRKTISKKVETPVTHICKARQYSDQMICGACGLAWDTNDPDRPACIIKTK